MKFLYPINLVKNEIQNAVIQNLSSAPANPKVGQIYFNTTDQELMVYTRIGTDPLTFAWDVVGANFKLTDDILKGSINGANLKYSPYVTAEAGVLSSTLPVAANDVLSWSGYFYANRFNNLDLTEGGYGFTIAGGTEDRNSLIFNANASYTGNLTLNSWTSSSINIFKNFAIGTSTTGSGTITISSLQNASPTLILGANGTANQVAIFDTNGALTGENLLATTRGGTGIGSYTTGDILYANATNTLATLPAGTTGQALRINSEGLPVWTTGGSVDQTLTLTVDGGTTEGTSKYTYDGSTAKIVDFIGGTDVDLAAAAGTVTVNHATITRTDTTSTASPNFNGTFTAVDGITTSSTGHITAVNLKTVTIPTETTLSKVDEDTGTWLTGLSVSDHAITLSRSNTTTAKITVGELEVVKAEGVSNGNVLIGNDLTVTGNLTVQGTTTTLNTEEVNIEDNLILINSNQTGTPATSLMGGIEVNRGSETNYRLVFVENTQDFRVGKYDDTDPEAVINGLQPVLTRDETTNLTENDLLVWDAENKRAVGKRPSDLSITRKYIEDLEIETGDNYIVEHNLGTQDVVVSLRDADTKEMIYADVTIIDGNEIKITFGEINGVTDVKVTVIG
jgi:formylmethanofuran dehydrogenase subunit D